VHTAYAKDLQDLNGIGDQKVTADYFKRYRLLNVSGIADSILALSAWYPHYRYHVIKIEKALTKVCQSRRIPANL
jgi:hypothetical protein